MQRAINKAIEGGYEVNLSKGYYYNQVFIVNEDDENYKYELLLDPKFFQALGKAEGWGKCSNPDHSFITAVGGEIGRLGCPVCGHDPDKIIEPNMWKEEMHYFIDHIIEGKDIDSFFNNLLK